MSTKHYFPDTAANRLVPRALRALVASTPHLELDDADRVVADTHHDPSNVSIIGGGGSGHEPAWSGYVGHGLLSAAACGDIFASPSAMQVMKAVRMAPSSRGIILLITNYTGDRLHFGLAAEKAKAEGLVDNIAVLPATDDASIGRSDSSRLGRRGLAGHVIAMKILGGAAAKGYSFQYCLDIGQAVNESTVTIGSVLDHCHVPGRQHQTLDEDTCVIGAGIHNEPGQQVVTPLPSVEDLIDKCLHMLCDPRDPERAFTGFTPGDDVILLVNNYGGLSSLELGALTDETLGQLASKWGISPCKILTGAFETSLNAPGFSVSLCNITAAAKRCESRADALIQLLCEPTMAVSWPNTTMPRSDNKKGRFSDTNNSLTKNTTDHGGIQADASTLERMIRSACKRVMAAEPRLTEWDMIMGDGDCGEAVKGLAESVLSNLDSRCPPTGSIFDFLALVTRSVELMGGTLGAIFSILLSAFHTALNRAVRDGGIYQGTPRLYAAALLSAVASLKKHTPAREGDRTVMDVLLPFSAEFHRSEDLDAAVKVAAAKAEETKYTKAKFGRATYVGQEASQEVPDPGAWALFEIVAGLAEGVGMKMA